MIYIMRTMTRSALLAASLVFVAPMALAQTDADRATARELGKDGETALTKRDFKTAEDLFRRAESLFHAPTLLLGYARAEAGLGKVVNAAEAYNRIIREGVSPGAPPVFVNALASAKAEVGAVQARIATVTITIAGPADPKVTLDDTPVPSAALGVRRPIDPGAHVLKATADGFDPGQTTFSVADAGSTTAALTLNKTKAVPAGAVAVLPVPGPTPTTTTPPEPSSPPPLDSGPATGAGSTQRTIGIVGIGVGAAGLVLGGITGALAMGKHSSINTACGGTTCPSSESSDISSYHSLASISTVGFIAGAALAAGGVVLFLTAPHGSSAPTTGTTVQPFIGLGTLGALGRF
jgi:hypothetical protein